MSRKDYIQAARIIVRVADVEIRTYLAQEFADMFEAGNPNFDRNRFLHACGTELDTSSSASRQHYIETGKYLLVGEAL